MASKRFETSIEVAAIATMVSLAVKGGANVISALEIGLQHANGRVAEMLKEVLARIELGASFTEASEDIRSKTSGTAVEEFLSKLQQSAQLGSGLAEQLDDLVLTLNSEVAVAKMANANANETKMLLPLVFLILPVTVIFALYPSLQMLNLQMEGT